MAATLRIKRSQVTGNPATLAAGELAYSGLTDNGSNGGDRLYIGMGTETGGNAANHVVIGGKYFTDMLDHNKGTLTASSALIVDSDKKLDNLLVDGLELNDNTLSATGTLKLQSSSNNIEIAANNVIAGGSYGGSQLFLDSGNVYLKQLRDGNINFIVGTGGSATSQLTFNNDGSLTVPGTIKTLSNGDLTLSPNGTGKVSIAGAYKLPRVDGTAGYVLTTDGSGNVSWQGSGIPTFTVTTATAGVSSLSYNNGTFTFTPPDLSSYATQSYVTGLGYITGISGSDVTTALGYTPLQSSDLSGYATESYVGSQGFITSSALSGYATESYVGSQGYITTASLSVTTLTASTASSLTYNNGEFKFTPTDLSSYATVSYVQGVAQGLHIHEPVKAATTASLASITGDTVTYDNGIGGVGSTLTLGTALTVLDGYTLQNGDRILVKDESTQANNGIYTWATGGTVLTRAVYEDEPSQFAGGDFIFVSNGTVNGDTGWVQTENISSFGSNSIIFQQFAGAGTYQAGTGLSLAGNVFSINTTYAGQSSITTLGTVTAGTWNADTISSSKGGTGITTYSAYDLLVGTIAGGLTKLPMGLAGQFLQVNSAGDGLTYADIDGGTY